MGMDFKDFELGFLSELPQEKVNDIEKDEAITPGDIEREKSLVAIDLSKEELESRKQDREQRKTFSFWIFIFICVYMAITLIVVILVGSSVLKLSDKVSITLLSTTTANVLGLFVIVAKYLFHTKE